MATITETVFVRKGSWRTLRTFFRASATGVFLRPAGATIKVRFGVSFLGFDRQKQSLDGETTKTLVVSLGSSLLRARMQIRVSKDDEVTYTLHLPGP
jgi:hypothetical protein